MLTNLFARTAARTNDSPLREDSPRRMPATPVGNDCRSLATWGNRKSSHWASDDVWDAWLIDDVLFVLKSRKEQQPIEVR
jgi:hypothetical protein